MGSEKMREKNQPNKTGDLMTLELLLIPKGEHLSDTKSVMIKKDLSMRTNPGSLGSNRT